MSDRFMDSSGGPGPRRPGIAAPPVRRGAYPAARLENAMGPLTVRHVSTAWPMGSITTEPPLGAPQMGRRHHHHASTTHTGHLVEPQAAWPPSRDQTTNSR
jgi:hypothetical protein